MGTTPSPTKDFDFNDYVCSHFSCYTLSTIATLKNAIKRSIIKQKGRSGEISITKILALYIYIIIL